MHDLRLDVNEVAWTRLHDRTRDGQLELPVEDVERVDVLPVEVRPCAVHLGRHLELERHDLVTRHLHLGPAAGTFEDLAHHLPPAYRSAASASAAHSLLKAFGTTTHSFICRPAIGSKRCAPSSASARA